MLERLSDRSTFDEVAAAIITEAIRRRYDRNAVTAILSTAIQESALKPAALSPNGLWLGIFQQDSGYAGRGAAATQISGFFDRLDAKVRAAGASSDPWLNIFWLQQRPSEKTADNAYENGRKAYLEEIKRHVQQASTLYDRFAVVTAKGWTGDPVWLRDVLRAEGLTVREVPGWLERGHGNMGTLWGVMAHHTGSNNASAESIAFHPELGLCSQIHLGRDGVVTLCGVGEAWHAGAGSYPGLGTNNANPVTIGIEAANDGGGPPVQPHRSCWPDAQYLAYVKTVAAILRRIGKDSSRVIGHKEWAGRTQGKIDPGGIDMDRFRIDVQNQIDSKTTTSNAGDSMASVPQDQWDRVYRELTQEHSSLSMYRTPGEGSIGSWCNITRNIDAMTHADWVEYCAIRFGDVDSIHRIVRVAAGDGADRSEWGIAHAKSVLAAIPTEFLDAYKVARK